ncbi:YopX family protein [Flavobacterium filum]|uniref:YopX family protein n=1 Tax=Flavobacterium filum TaxID=370974 RepID=UPI0023F132EC|nr:YopX family protein [Flavobacterium filum]
MREIKFRAWDKKESCFVNPENLVIRADCGAVFDREFDIELHDIDLMQYTGLKDKNGKEIYFDDFYRYNNIDYLVKWNKAKISLLDIANGDIIDYITGGKIKSNIYENEYQITGKHTEIP